MALLIVAALALRVAYRARTRQLGPPPELDDPYGLEPATRAERTAPGWIARRRAYGLLALAALMTLIGITIGDPYGVLDSGFRVVVGNPPAVPGNTFFQLGPVQLFAEQGKYLYQLGEEAAIQRGTADVPFTRQYIGTIPVVYHFQQLVQWGMGPASGIPALFGLFAAFWFAIRRRRPAEILLLSGMIPYFLTIVTLEAKWMRYMLPLVPYMCILGAALLLRGLHWSAAARDRIALRLQAGKGVPVGLRLRRWAFPLITAVAVLGSAAWATAFMNIYTHEESRVIASRWMAHNMAPGSAVGHETWDDALPLNMPGDPLPSLTGVDMGLYDDKPSPEEFNYIAGLLNQTDYIVLSSNRLWRSIPNLPWRYPVQIRYYDLLMSGKLGFKQVLPEAYQKVYPEIFGIKINDDSADESFTVYDHPQVLVFHKERSLSMDELRTLFGATLDQVSIPARHLETRTPQTYDKSLMLAEPPGQQLALGDYAWNALAQNQWVAVLLLLIAVEVFGLLAWPLTAVVCRRLPDRGYPLSKTLALVVVAWMVWMGASLRLVPFTVWSILGGVVLLGLLSAFLWRRFGSELREYMRSHRALILAWEGLFLLAFGAFLLVRLLNPDLWQPWNGGEKPMEFGFLNSVLRSPWMPPGDPFYSGGYVNYYYYGYFLLGTLIKLIGVDPAVGFNIVLPLLYGLTVLGGASIVYNCVATVQRARGWRGGPSTTAFGWGLVGALLFVGIGNLTFLLQWISMTLPGLQQAVVGMLGIFGPVNPDLARTVAGWDYWAASRVIPGTINEFPYWSFLFADLHPHLIDLSVSLLALGLLFNLVLGAWRWPVFAALPARFTEATVPAVPAPGVFARPDDGFGAATWRATLEAGHRLWGSAPFDGFLRFALTALALGTLFAVNSWDFPLYVVVGIGALLVAILAAWQSHAARRAAVRLGALIGAAGGLVIASGVALVFYAPFLLTFKPFYNQIKTITPEMRRTQFDEFLVVWGLFLLIGFTYLALRLRQYPWRAALDDWQGWLVRGGRPGPVPAPAPAEAIPAARPAATTYDVEMSRFLAPAAPTGGAVAQVAAGNGHAEPVAVAERPVAPDEWEEYGLGDVGAADFAIDETELVRVARPRIILVDAPDEGETGGHSAEADDYDFVDTSLPHRANGNGIVAYDLPVVAETDPYPAGSTGNGHPPALPPDGESAPLPRDSDPAGPTMQAGPAPVESGTPPAPEMVAPAAPVEQEAAAPDGLVPEAVAATEAHDNGAYPALAPDAPITERLAAVVPDAALTKRLAAAEDSETRASLADEPEFIAEAAPDNGADPMSADAVPSEPAADGEDNENGVHLPVDPETMAAEPAALDGDAPAPEPALAGVLDEETPPAPGWRIAPVYDELEPVGAHPGPRPRGLLPAGVGLAVLGLTALATLGFLLTKQPLEAMLILLIGGLVATHLSGLRAPGQLFDGLMLTVGFIVALGVEYIYLADHLAGDPTYYRMNTVFKFYEQVWVLVALGGAVALYSLLGPRGRATEAAPAPVAGEPEAAPEAAPAVEEPRVLHGGYVVPADPDSAPGALLPVASVEDVTPVRESRGWFSPARAIWLVPFGLLLLGSLIFTITGTQARVADRMPGERPAFGTLNGMDWMDKTVLPLAFGDAETAYPVTFRFERAAVDWLNTHIAGTPVIAAAPIGYYREAGMLPSTYSGLPMVVGGLHQDEQRYGWLVGERRNDMTNFYRTDNTQEALLLINKYDIEYIYVGQIERIAYQKSPTGLSKFDDMVKDQQLEVAFQSGPVTIYHVRGPQVQAAVGVAPGSPAAQYTPRPRPTEPPLGADPTVDALLATVQADPNNLDAHRALADYYRNHQAIQKAIDQYVEVVRLAPQDVPAHHILGDLYSQNGEADKALAVWELAVQDANPGDKPAAYNKVGIAYQSRQRFTDAMNAFKSAVAANPKFVEAWFHLGEVYQSMQSTDSARDAFQNCIKNAPADDSGQHWAQEAQKRLDTLH
jgi:uncharacterized membrane protein/Tfp pilus assembly protein PilF